MLTKHLRRVGMARSLLQLERQWSPLSERIRLGRSLGWLAIVGAIVGVAILPVSRATSMSPLPWVLLAGALAGGVALVAFPIALLDRLPHWAIAGSAVATQTGFVLGTGDVDSPFLPGFTAIVLATAISSNLRPAAVAVALAAGGLLVVALADADLSTAEVIRIAIDAVVLLAVAAVVSTLAWRRRLDVLRASRRVVRAREDARLHRLEAETDLLTGVGSRRAFEAAVATLERTRALSRIALLFVDVDGLKVVNDRLGHLAGDATLRALAAALRARLRPEDRLYRVGGDEFAAIVKAGSAARLAGRLGGRISADVAGVGVVSASIGIVVPSSTDEAAAVVALADRRMYATKRGVPLTSSPPAA